MIRILIVTVLATLVISQVSPPVWPETFHQNFVESYASTRMHVTGKVYYDSKRDTERVDRVDGQF